MCISIGLPFRTGVLNGGRGIGCRGEVFCIEGGVLREGINVYFHWPSI